MQPRRVAEKVAGGRSEAETSGHESIVVRTPKGCQTLAPFQGADGSSLLHSGGLRPPATVCHAFGMMHRLLPGRVRHQRQLNPKRRSLSHLALDLYFAAVTVDALSADLQSQRGAWVLGG